MPRPAVHTVRVPAPDRDGWVNALVLPGAPATVVDPGPDTPAARHALKEGLADAGLTVAGIGLVVVTHTHVSHFGLAAWIQEAAGARVACHPLAVTALQNVPQALTGRLNLMVRAARASDVPAGLAASATDLWRSRMALARSVEAGKLLPLPDGASLHAGEGPWRVLHCPGHARDHLCLLHRESGSLIGGDLLLRSRRTVPWLESRREDGSRPATLADLIRSWRRLSRQRLEIVWPGHGRPVRAHRILVARRIAETREGLQATLEAVTGGAATVGELAGALDMSVTADGLFASLSEIVARTDWLVERGLLERRTATGVLRFLPR